MGAEAAAKASTMTAEEAERLLSDPRIRELQYKLRTGADKFKLEVTNEKPQEVRNIMVPPDASPEEQMRLVQQAMEEDAKNKQRAADEEARRAAAAKAERIARSDVWCYVLSGAGSEELNGPFHRDGSAVRNGARVYTNGAGFVMSREVINGGEGWIIGRAPKAYYGFQTKDTLAPETGWSVQEHGKAPSPTVAAMEPAMAVEAAKQAGNAAFKAGQHADAIQQYGEALRIARACVGAYGLSDELLARLHANRAEAHLQMEHSEEAEADADRALELDPCFVKAYVRKAKALYAREQWDAAAAALRDALDVAPGTKEVLALQEEYRVGALARSGSEAVLSELAGLLSRFDTLVRRKGMASEVSAILRQLPSLLQSLRAQPTDDKAIPGGLVYVSAPNHDAQVYVRLATSGFASLAPLIRPMPKGKDELLCAVLETVAAATRECPTNQVAFDRFVPQLVPILRGKSTASLEVLRAAVRVLGSTAHRASARRVMHDPDTAEGLMHVLAFPDSSSQRLHVAVIAALDDMRDTATLANLLAVDGAPETFWREAHSRNAEANVPARGLIGTAMGSAACRKRLNLKSRTKRLTELIDKMVGEAPVREEYYIAKRDSNGDDDDDEVKWELRDVAALPARAAGTLAAIVEGLGTEASADAEFVEALSRLDAWGMLVPMAVARPPVSAAALRCLRVGMEQTQHAIDAVGELGLPIWLLQCREPSSASDDFNANVATTMLAQSARNDACQLLGFVANQAIFHECAELYDTHDVLHAMCELLAGSPSDDAACGGARALFHLLRYKKSKRLSALAAKDVHDILVPLFLRKTGAAKEAVMQALRVAMADTRWMEAAWPYFQSRGSAPKVYQVVQEMNGLDDLKALATTGKTGDKLRQGNQTITQSLETSHRLEALQPAKVAAFFAADLPPDATVLDVGAGTGIFSFALASALPGGRVLALEVRSDAIRAIRARADREGVGNISAMRMAEDAAPELPDGRRAHLVLLCDVLEMVPEHARESFVNSLRALLAPGGRLVVICERSQSDGLLVDIQDAGFLQRRVAQMVTNRRVMLFEADPAAPQPPAPQPAPDELPEDSLAYVEPADGAEPGSVGATGAEAGTGGAGGAAGGKGAAAHEVDRTPSRDVEDESDDEAGGGCMLEENPAEGSASEGEASGCMLEAHAAEDAGGCILEENAGQYEGGCMLEQNVGGEGSDDGGCALEDNATDEGGCMLEENAAAGAPAEEEDDGCMLEDNDAEAEEPEDCLLEDNA